MATINASTTHAMKQQKKKKAPPAGPKKLGVGVANKTAPKGKAATKRGSAIPLQPQTLKSAAAIAQIQKLNDNDEKRQKVLDLYRRAIGIPVHTTNSLSTPHTASTTRERMGAAADLAVVAKHTSIQYVLLDCGIIANLQRNLFSEGGVMPDILLHNYKDDDDDDDDGDGAKTPTLKASASAVSLASLVSSNNDELESIMTAANSMASDSKRGKTMPPATREGSLLILRALCEICVPVDVEPYICGAFLAASIDECASTNSHVREAAEDTTKALLDIANPWTFAIITCPILLHTLQTSTEWRCKAIALERMSHCSKLAPTQVQKHIPKLLPKLTNQVWDTKAQVSKAARAALLAVCQTNTNPDIAKTIPSIVNAICKPSETNKAVTELMGTTFVVPVTESTLAILCPLLSRALKEKLAVHKRSACIVISNMSKLVESPSAIRPFGSLLVPELQKVAANVQFEEIRDESLKALKNLTKALGAQYKAAAAAADGNKEDGGMSAEESNLAVAALEEEQSRVQAEQDRIEQERQKQARIEEEQRLKEEEEKKKFKEAMDAQRRLELLEEEKVAAHKAEEKQKKEMQKLSTKGTSGKCQSCGLKKCRKTCMFYSGK